MAGVEKEITTLKKNGPSLEDLNKFKAEYTRVHELQLRENEIWIDYLSTQNENNEDPNQWLDYNDRQNKVTVSAVQKGANKWLDGKNILRFVLLPEK